MKNRMTLLVTGITAVILACSSSPSVPTPAPVQDVNTATVMPVIENPTNTVTVPAPVQNTPLPDSDLTETEILEIVRSSLAAYPWRLTQTVQVNATGSTSTSVTEAQSETRGYSRSEQTLGTETIIIENILIDTSLYLKVTGSPAETYGVVSGQWTQVAPDSPLNQLVDTGVIEPARIADTFLSEFAMVRGEGGGELVFTLAGSETVNGTVTNIYEVKGAASTYRWWIGVDRHFHKTTLELPEATRTIVVEYDAAIDIQPPMP